MNLDLVSSFPFGDGTALRAFLLIHRFVHGAEAAALTARFNVPSSTFGIGGSQAEEAWIEMMQAGERRATPAPLKDWLQLHADLHVQAYSLLGSAPSTAPDLSVVDFSSPEEFYDWMQAHQEIHDYEMAQLGLS
jgi:hypothetical protein